MSWYLPHSITKNKYYAKKIMGAEKFHNYIIYYADSLRHYWTANTIYILIYSSSLSYLLLYYTHETRTRIYYYYIITLFFFALFFSYYYIFFFIILYSYILIYPTKFKQKQIIYCYIFYLLLYILQNISYLFYFFIGQYFRSVFRSAPKFKTCQLYFTIRFHNYFILLAKHFPDSDFFRYSKHYLFITQHLNSYLFIYFFYYLFISF